jgi:hypothetical protein
MGSIFIARRVGAQGAVAATRASCRFRRTRATPPRSVFSRGLTS